MVLDYIYFDEVERKICCNCVDDLRVRVKPETLKKVGYSTVYRTDKSEEEEEEVEGVVLGGGGDEISIMPFVYPRGAVSVSSLSYFSSVCSSSKPSHTSLPLSLSQSTLYSTVF